VYNYLSKKMNSHKVNKVLVASESRKREGFLKHEDLKHKDTKAQRHEVFVSNKNANNWKILPASPLGD
jgi:hypothetical protein